FGSINRAFGRTPNHAQNSPWPKGYFDKISQNAATLRRKIVQHRPKRLPHRLGQHNAYTFTCRKIRHC
ncbi:MAG: hypothetical protein ACI85H_001552, partial [Paracoccaceae bacterium]